MRADETRCEGTSSVRGRTYQWHAGTRASHPSTRRSVRARAHGKVLKHVLGTEIVRIAYTPSPPPLALSTAAPPVQRDPSTVQHLNNPPGKGQPGTRPSDDVLAQALQPLPRCAERVEVLAEREARVVLADPDVLFAVELCAARGPSVSRAQV